jgi:hypothetical protein
LLQNSKDDTKRTKKEENEKPIMCGCATKEYFRREANKRSNPSWKEGDPDVITRENFLYVVKNMAGKTVELPKLPGDSKSQTVTFF